jgi:hypothetical protein
VIGRLKRRDSADASRIDAIAAGNDLQAGSVRTLGNTEFAARGIAQQLHGRETGRAGWADEEAGVASTMIAAAASTMRPACTAGLIAEAGPGE